MRVYRYGNQYKKVKKSFLLECVVAFSLTFYTGMILTQAQPLHPNTATQFLQKFSFGVQPSMVLAVEPKIAGVSGILKKPETKEEIINASHHAEEIFHIWEKETSKGTNKNPNALHNVCKAKGKTNEFGFGGMAHMWCFDSFQEAVTTIDEWLTKRDKESLCYYNVGVRTEDCTYVK